MTNRSRLWVTIGLMVAVLMSSLDQTIVDTAFPKMTADLGGTDIFTWVITAYLLASTCVVPVVGKLADLFGRKVFYLLGLGLFVAGSILSGAAHSMPQLIAFRAVQGLGGGMLMPVVLTLIGDLFPGKERAKLQGIFGAAFGLAAILGPKLGGWITHHFSWRWVFYVNIPFCVAAFLVGAILLKESRGERRPVDYAGAVTVAAGVGLLMLGLTQGQVYSFETGWVIASLVAGVLLLALFCWIELRVAEPILDLRLFVQNRVYLVMSVVSFLMGVGMFGCMIFVPWFIQGVVGVDPNAAGSVMTPMMLTIVFVSAFSGRLATKVQYRYLVGAGFALFALGFAVMTSWTAATTQWQASLATVIIGAGMGCMMPLLTLAVQNAVPARYRGQVTSGSTFFRSMGGVMGTAVFGILFNHQMQGQFATHLGTTFTQLQAAAPQAAPMLEQLAAKAQALVQVLLKPELQAMIPAPAREAIVTGVKAMMVDSMHTVFWVGVVIVLAGLVASQFLGRTSLPRQLEELAAGGEQAAVQMGVAAAD